MARQPGARSGIAWFVGVAALSCVAAGLLNAPQRLYYALSSDGVLSGSSHVEIAMARISLVVLGVVLGMALVLARVYRDTPFVRGLAADHDDFLRQDAKAPRENLLRSSRSADAMVFGTNALVFAGLVQTIRWSFDFYGRDVVWFDRLALESGGWETLTAVCLLLGGAVLVRAGWTCRRGFALRGSFVVPCSMGALFILGAGEEVSWGQHWLGFDTPELLRSANTQGEANLHNLYGHWANNLQMAVFFLYIGVLPLLARGSSWARYLADRLALPVAPVVLVPFAVMGTLMDSRARFGALWGSPPWRLSEGRETLFGIAILCIALLARSDWRARRFHLDSRVDNPS